MAIGILSAHGADDIEAMPLLSLEKFSSAAPEKESVASWLAAYFFGLRFNSGIGFFRLR